MDKTLIRKLDQGITIGRRIATSLEKLVDEPMVEVQSRPAQCPHCGMISPTVEISKQDDPLIGRLTNYIVEAKCTNCNQIFWALPANWTMFSDWDSVLEIANRLREENNGK